MEDFRPLSKAESSYSMDAAAVLARAYPQLNGSVRGPRAESAGDHGKGTVANPDQCAGRVLSIGHPSHFDFSIPRRHLEFPLTPI